ncbi:HlyD family secretion protein [Microbulbifer sp. Q7]|uniref:HlyD family secretion protein n=1 Tax=Microbulbifer sp. Q7 TaxID=1785091 RepID=UPI00082D32A3|nr:HlyD family secretion protein [Microbulbifer sp. Q7]
MQISRKTILTALVVLVAALAVVLRYQYSRNNPWTRDGQVRAAVIQVTPNVSGQVVIVGVNDNQFVEQGALLFEIDPRPFKARLEQARAEYDRTGDSYLAQEQNVESVAAQLEVARASVLQAESAIREVDAVIQKNEAELQRQQRLLPQRATSQKQVERALAQHAISLEQRKGAQAALVQARANLSGVSARLDEARATLGELGDANPSIRAARAALREAQLNFEFTRITAPANGYVTNLNLRVGSQAVANQPALALVDVDSFWIEGFFRETAVAHISPGDRAVVTLMGYPDRPIEGRVESIGWGIAQQDGATGRDLLPQIRPTFEWIRLAQRIPVKIALGELPDGVLLRVGTSASVQVLGGTAPRQSEDAPGLK